MEASPEKVGAELLRDLDKHNTPDCLSLAALGQYIEHTLPSEEAGKVEKHLTSCLYCLNQLVELRELLFLEKKAEPLSPQFEESLRRLATKQNNSAWMTLPEVFKAVKNSLSELWNSAYGWQSATAVAVIAILAVYLGVLPRGAKEPTIKAPSAVPSEPNVAAQSPASPEAKTAFLPRGSTDSPMTAPTTVPGEPSIPVQPGLSPSPTPTVKTELLPKRLLLSLSEFRIGTNVQRIASVLEKLPKNLILEQTRGEKEVELYRTASRGVVLVVTKESLGSGALITANGQILTNWHVVGNNPQVVVVFKPRDGSDLKKELAFSAMVEKIDQLTDLALLRILIPPKDVRALRLAEGSAIEVGQDVHAIGHPEGEVWTYTKGIISQVRDNYEWSTDGRVHRAKVIQTQTPVNPGNSGGPLLDDKGRVIGINSFRRSGEGLNYAVAIDTIQEFLKRQGSRSIPQTQAAARADELKCSEAYDTMNRGWNDLVGCYKNTSTPPPDLWFVFKAPGDTPSYAGLDSNAAQRVDTVIKGRDKEWNVLEMFVDGNCDGIVDLVAYKRQEETDFSSFQLPPQNLRLTVLVKELDQAFKSGKVSKLQMRVCQ